MNKKIILNYKKSLLKLSFFLIFIGFGFFLFKNRQFVRGIYSPGKIFVKISGNVKKPGVYGLISGSSLNQLIDKAGGLLNPKDTKTIYNPDLILSNGQVVILGTGK